jgi:alkylation response protein AidB-like acyl-CoA dehydrogenase
MAAPVEYGGGGAADFRFNAVMNEEFCAAGVGASAACVLLHNDTCLPYFLAAADDEQKARWLPGICSGELMTAIAMTEPGAGSDLAAIRTTAVRDGDEYVVNGSKTFITNGFNADLFVVACKTDPAQRHKGMSLLVIEGDRPGFERGRNLDKIGQHARTRPRSSSTTCGCRWPTGSARRAPASASSSRSFPRSACPWP